MCPVGQFGNPSMICTPNDRKLGLTASLYFSTRFSTGRYKTSDVDKTHCIILRFVRNDQTCLTGDQYRLLGYHDIMTAAATSLGKHHIRVLSVVVATVTWAGAQEDKSARRLSKHTLSLHPCTLTLIYGLLALNDCQLAHLISQRRSCSRDEATKEVK